MCVTRISHGLMINEVMLLASRRRLILGGPMITLTLTGKSLSHCQVRANETYAEAKREFSDRNRDILLNVHSPHK